MITLEDLLSLCKAFNDCKVKYVLIGGWAVIFHGLVRTTIDVDIIIDKSPENINGMKRAFSRFIKEDEIAELNPEMAKKHQVVRKDFLLFYSKMPS